MAMLLGILLSPPAKSDIYQYDWSMEAVFKYDMYLTLGEYYYHSSKWGDSKEVSTMREQKLIKEIEEPYFITGNFKKIDDIYNLNAFIPSTGFAKMFMHYGNDPFYTSKTGITSIIFIISQNNSPEPKEDLVGKEIQEYIAIRMDSHPGAYTIFGFTLSANSVIKLTKLYLALGVDMHAIGTSKGVPIDALVTSFIRYDRYNHIGHIILDKFPPAEPIPDYYTIQPKADTKETVWRKSKVTYWLEEFIAAGYPASMLDTHKLHYPRFMKDASVAQVTAMIQKSYSYKIPTNQNCPYKETCPLVPSVNMRDAMGRTPLHIAGEQGNKAVFDHLISMGADKSIKDYRGKLPKI